MKKALCLIALAGIVITLSGCNWSDPFARTKQNTRQTIRNTSAMILDANSQELYADK